MKMQSLYSDLIFPLNPIWQVKIVTTEMKGSSIRGLRGFEEGVLCVYRTRLYEFYGGFFVLVGGSSR